MEETKWLTKGKIITIVVIILAIGATVAGILIHKNNVKKDYAKFDINIALTAPPKAKLPSTVKSGKSKTLKVI